MSHDIRITRVETAIVEDPIRAARVVISHLGAHSQSRFLNVTVHGEAGLRGYGEAATRPTSAESFRLNMKPLMG